MVTFSTARQTVEEDAGSAKVTARLTALSGLDVIVPLSFSGIARSPDDYTLPADASILIPAGSYSRSVSIPIVNDSDPERSETILVSMLAPTNAVLFVDLDGNGIQDPGESALPGMTTVQTITIAENDAPSVSFTTAHRRVSEGVGTVYVTAKLSASYYNAVDVPISVSGTAGSGDYSVTLSSIHFNAYQTSATIPVSVVNDSLGEEAETVVLTLSDPPDDARLGPAPSYVLEIDANDRPFVSFVSTRQSVWETDANGNPVSATITAKLSNTSTLPVEVPLIVYGGSAEVSDYILTSSSITIAAGGEYGTTTLQIVDDAENEGSETVNLKMDTPPNGYINSYWPPRYTLTIQDDDPTVSFDWRGRRTVSEDGGYHDHLRPVPAG